MSRNVTHSRKNDLAKIHIARNQLGLSDDDYRAVLWARCNVHSAADLDHSGRQHLLQHFRALGWKAKAPRKRLHAKRLPESAGEHKANQLAKIEALLLDAGKPTAYADGMAQHMFRVQKVTWCDAEQLHKIIAALNIQARREGREYLDSVQDRLADRERFKAYRAGQSLSQDRT